MIEKLFTRKEADYAARQGFEIHAGWRYGVVFGAVLVLVGWGIDAWESANASLELSWVKLPLAAITLLPLCAMAGGLAARFNRSLVKMAIWGIAGAITGWIAIHLPFEGVSMIASLSDPALGGTVIFSFAPAAQERVVGMMAFGAMSGLIAPWAQKLATLWAWDRSSLDNRMTLGGWVTLLACAPIAMTLGALYDGGANASLRGPSRLTQRLIQVALNAADLNRAGIQQALDLGMTARWRDKFSAHYTQRIADFDRRTLEDVYMDTEFDNGFLWRCQITRDGSNMRHCSDLGETYRDWITQFLQTSRIRCDECVFRVEPEVIAWQTKNAGALVNPRQIDVIHDSGGVVTVRAAFENQVVECRIVGAEPMNIQECSYVK